MDYQEIAKESVGYLYKAHRSIRTTGLEVQLIALAELRTSQLNGCAYCCAYHANELREMGLAVALIDQLPGWRLATGFDLRQQLVLEWTEVVTTRPADFKSYYPLLLEHFTEKELAELTTSISLMNALNRLRMTLGNH
ncbi:carboxymuconolactone decarboxylase family protein [Chitinophaga nivalis]|uniref:Carboxymuconolactone decarboxylase family protein n=1 Tax=Chitinophaga nivalis TaxID=2991709 RepID=A0ABT3INA5_9BACT|nr:carboxymuconolactone decarboxylase family protein [Chitinophaga nivalis]MCW3464842.1 carboxymuconolactone decarboxylase family protein [Chitinophaga nivalis]MCW3485467.1 carboxymuconolactone decarboxylase family protein [Chitinophaga nivalis]